jgi:GNAT superfamily N-acetyltransferase
VKTGIEPLVDAPPADPAALPPEWAEWSEEPGQRVSIEDDGRVVGMLHVIVVGPAEGWLEGLWVQPAARGRGVGRRLVQEAEDLLRGYGVGTVRTAIPSRDYEALAVAERAGFSRCTETNVLVADIEAGPIDIAYDAQVRPAEPPEGAAILHLLAASSLLGAWRGLVPLGWRFRHVRSDLLRGLINDAWSAPETVEGVAAFAVLAGARDSFLKAAGHHEAFLGHRGHAAWRRPGLFAPGQPTIRFRRVSPHPGVRMGVLSRIVERCRRWRSR